MQSDSEHSKMQWNDEFATENANCSRKTHFKLYLDMKMNNLLKHLVLFSVLNMFLIFIYHPVGFWILNKLENSMHRNCYARV